MRFLKLITGILEKILYEDDMGIVFALNKQR
jgi:hypothetical protein